MSVDSIKVLKGAFNQEKALCDCKILNFAKVRLFPLLVDNTDDTEQLEKVLCQEDSGETAPQLILEVPSDTETEQQQGPGRHQARARHIHRARGEARLALNLGDHMIIR